jgi:hypothetical protein
VQAPLAEVLAVVGKQTVPILADARASALDDLRRCEGDALVNPHADAMPVGKPYDRHFFNRSSMEATRESVVYDLAAAHVDPVMSEAQARGHEVRAAPGFFALGQLMIASEHVLTSPLRRCAISIQWRPQSQVRTSGATAETRRRQRTQRRRSRQSRVSANTKM